MYVAIVNRERKEGNGGGGRSPRSSARHKIKELNGILAKK